MIKIGIYEIKFQKFKLFTKLFIVSILLIAGIMISVNLVYKGMKSFDNQDYDNIVLRNSYDFRNDDFYLINKTYGGLSEESIHDIKIDNDGNILAVGYTDSYGVGQNDIFLLKYNPRGDLIWNFTWGTIYLDRPEDITIDDQNNIYIAGYTKSPDTYVYDMQKIVLLKINRTGDLKWEIQEDFGTKGERALGIALTSNNDIIVSGYKHVLGTTGREILIIKYNSLGNQIWNNTWGLGSSYTLFGNDVVLDNFDNIYLSAYKYPGGDAILARFDSNGQYNWTKGWDWSKDWGMTIAIDNSSSFLYTSGYSRGNGMFLLKYDLYGNLIDEVSGFGGICPDSDYIESQKLNDTLQLRIDIDSKNNIYFASFNGTYDDVGNDLVIYKFDSSLNIIWEKTWKGLNNDYGFCIDTNIEKNQIAVGGKTYRETDGPADALILLNALKPEINFSLTKDYLNVSNPLETHNTLQINCTVLNSTSLKWVYLAENTSGSFLNRSMNLGKNNEWSFDLDISSLQEGDSFSFLFYAKNSRGVIGKNDNKGLNFSLIIGNTAPDIDFEPSDEYLNNTNLLETDYGIEINCTVLDSSNLEWVYLAENSSGNFLNRSMNLETNNEWTCNLDISSLQGGDSFSFLFYAKDSKGKIGIKDNNGLNYSIKIGNVAPNISINLPKMYQVFGNSPPNYYISVEDGNIDEVWYTLDKGVHNKTIETYTGTIDQELWSNQPNGNITLRFYANDTFGETTFEEIIITKDSQTGSKPNSILGFDIFIVIPLIILTSIFYIKKKY